LLDAKTTVLNERSRLAILFFHFKYRELPWEGDVEVLTMKELLETGVHFGHRTRKWNPKMGRYIFTERKGIHIIDLEQTVDLFKRAYFFIRDRIAQGDEILFVGTKRQVQATIEEEARRCGAHYVSRRWLGGTLTNFVTIKRSIDRMKELEGKIEDGSIDHIPNKEATRLRRELAKLKRNLDGLRHMTRLPHLLYVIDPDIEVNAVREANILKIPIIAIVDTNCNPDLIDFLIPGNDDAIKATKLITSRIADAVLEGREGRQDQEEAMQDQAPAEAETAEVEEESEEETVEDAGQDDAAAAPTSEPTEATAETSEEEAPETVDESESPEDADEDGEEEEVDEDDEEEVKEKEADGS
jgi:small subunit ribosomal protein S2